jgi:hypothetical protein
MYIEMFVLNLNNADTIWNPCDTKCAIKKQFTFLHHLHILPKLDGDSKDGLKLFFIKDPVTQIFMVFNHKYDAQIKIYFL